MPRFGVTAPFPAPLLITCIPSSRDFFFLPSQKASHSFSKSGDKFVHSSQSKVTAFGRVDPFLGHHFHLTMLNAAFHPKYPGCGVTHVFNAQDAWIECANPRAGGHVHVPMAGSATLVTLWDFSEQLSCPQRMEK